MKRSLSHREILEGINGSARERNEMLSYIYRSDNFVKPVFAFILKNGGQREDAEEILQDGLVNLVKAVRKGKFETGKSIRNYLFGICRFLWFRRYQQLKKRPTATDDFSQTEAQEESPEIFLVEVEKRTAIEALLVRVGSTCKQVLQLWAASYSMKEIAEKLGYSSDGVARKKKHQCLKKLVQLIEQTPEMKGLR